MSSILVSPYFFFGNVLSERSATCCVPVIQWLAINQRPFAAALISSALFFEKASKLSLVPIIADPSVIRLPYRLRLINECGPFHIKVSLVLSAPPCVLYGSCCEEVGFP